MAHDHSPDHTTKTDNMGPAFLVGITLNVAFVVVEAGFGQWAHSTALLADAAHNVSDVLGLVMAWAASVVARRAPSRLHTYGFRRTTVLAALGNVVLLLAAVGAVAWEAVGRLRVPVEPHGSVMMWVAAVGVVVNGVSAMLFHKGSKVDANVRGAFLHLAADAVVSAGVVVAGAVVWRTGWTWVDPVTSLLVSAVVLWGTWSLMRNALHLAVDGVPMHIELDAVRAYLASLPSVQAVHDLHVWAMSTTEVALTAHLVIPWGQDPPVFLAELDHELDHRFGIGHVTVQLEPAGNCTCARAREGAV